jgi:hypothetical protein
LQKTKPGITQAAVIAWEVNMKYRKVDVRTWNDEKFRALSRDGKLVFLFLMTHPTMTVVGAMRGSIAGLAEELEFSYEDFRKAFQEVAAKGMVKREEGVPLIWLPNFLKYNRPESPNVVKSWPAAFDLLPECAMKEQINEALKAFAQGLTKAFREAFAKAFPEAIAKSMPNQEQEQEQEQDYKNKSLSPRPEDFLKAWNENRGPLAEVKDFSVSRRAMVQRRIAEGLTLEKFTEAVRRCTQTPFLVGSNERGWKAKFDFLLQNDRNVSKVLEGDYAGSGSPGRKPVQAALPHLRTADDPYYSADAMAARKQKAEEEEREAYVMWAGMNEAYRAVNPWKGRVFERTA